MAAVLGHADASSCLLLALVVSQYLSRGVLGVLLTFASKVVSHTYHRLPSLVVLLVPV